METVEIALAANAPYFCGMLVTACSIAKSARQACRLSFNILDGGLEEEQKALMERRVKDYHADSVFRYLPVNDEMFAGYPAWHGNKMAYARLILPTALTDRDWCIYCDVDFLWLRDICELWSERLNPQSSTYSVPLCGPPCLCDKAPPSDARTPFLAQRHRGTQRSTEEFLSPVHNPQPSTHNPQLFFIGTADGNGDTLAREEAWFAKKGYPFDRETYFCSGLCFMNLKAFREERLIEKCAEILAANPDIQFPDQAALNIVTYGRRKIVSRDWQRFTYELTDEIVRQGCVVHHAGEIPWKPVKGLKSVLSDGILLWHRMNAEVRGISVWRSLRRYNSVGGILYHRALWYLLRTPGLRQFIRIALCASGKKGAWEMFEARSRRFGRGEG